MDPITIDSLRTLATLGGLDLTDEGLGALLPLVAAARTMMGPVRDALSGDIEPASQFRIL